jgi:hypothetical protein
VILDDLIVDGSACVGQDCVNGESFGFDTIRLKENNLRIKFQDTSNTASFPSNDWQITINDSSNGGQNKFSIDDIDGGRTPFTIEASAPSHSLYVDDGGRIGLGTSTPVVELHVKDGDTPTLRLEQDGSSGFTPQTWDVAANETNFFVRDATNGSKLVFRIRPDAPSNSIFVDTDGDVGFGTSSPSEGLHLAKSQSGDDVMLLVENTNASAGSGGAGFQFISAENNSDWKVKATGAAGDFKVKNQADNVNVFTLAKADGAVTGVFGDYHVASDMRKKKDIATIEDALEKVLALRGVNFRWKDGSGDGSLQMGLIAQEVEKVVPEVVHTSDTPMQIKAVEYPFLVGLLVEGIKEQQAVIDAQQAELDSLKLMMLQLTSQMERVYGPIPVTAKNSVFPENQAQ